MALRGMSVLLALLISIVAWPPISLAESADAPPCFWSQFDMEALRRTPPRLVDATHSLPIHPEEALMVIEASESCENGSSASPCGGLPATAWYNPYDGGGSTAPDFHIGASDTPRNVHVYLPFALFPGYNMIDVYAIFCIIGPILYGVDELRGIIEQCTEDLVAQLDPLAFGLCIAEGIEDAPPPV